MAKGASAEKTVREIRRKTRRKFSAEEKIRIVLEGLRGLTWGRFGRTLELFSLPEPRITHSREAFAAGLE